jgi:predicted TPR repeat methyltransferase
MGKMTMEQVNRNSYNRIADKWDTNRRRKGIDPCIADLAAELPSDAAVLDIGCGSGYPIAKYLSEHNFSVTGIDLSEKMIEKAKALNLKKASFFAADFMDWQADGLYDAVIAFDSLWHIQYDRQQLIYPKIAGFLKENGLFLFTHGKEDGSAEGKMFGEDFRYYALDGSVVKKLLAENGFQIVSWRENYTNEISGTRDLLAVARKVSQSKSSLPMT